MVTRKRVAVVGAGTMGSQAAWRLAARGAEVVGHDRFAAGHDRAAGGGESRIPAILIETGQLGDRDSAITQKPLGGLHRLLHHLGVIEAPQRLAPVTAQPREWVWTRSVVSPGHRSVVPGGDHRRRETDHRPGRRPEAQGHRHRHRTPSPRHARAHCRARRRTGDHRRTIHTLDIRHSPNAPLYTPGG